jgi:hypothetical protein
MEEYVAKQLFDDAAKVAKRFKISGYGGPGTGKTLFALSFPKVAIIDMEHGTDWYAGRLVVPELGGSPDFKVKHTKSAKVVVEIVDQLERMLEKDPGFIQTLAIDPITLLWEAIQEAFIKRLRAKKGEDANVQFQHWKDIKAPYRSLMTKLLNLPVHLVLMGREAALYEQKGGELTQVGHKIATEKDTPYVADIHLRFFTRPHPEKGHDVFFAQVEKDRTHLLQKGSIIKDCCYQKLADLAAKQASMGEGATPVYENDEEAVENDQALFDEPESKDHSDLINDKEIKPLWHELGWASGKVKATIDKHKFTDRAELGKFLANMVREQREANEQSS